MEPRKYTNTNRASFNRGPATGSAPAQTSQNNTNRIPGSASTANANRPRFNNQGRNRPVINRTGGTNNNQNTQNKDDRGPKKSGSFQYGGKHGVRRKPKTPPQIETRAEKKSDVPKILPGDIRIIPLGGVEEIGRNMTAIEIGNDIIVIDAGLQIGNESTPGVDYVIPNTSYLEEHKDRVRAMIVTHGHLDHIGGIPYIIDKIGNPKIYSRHLTNLLIRKRHSEFPYLPAINISEVEKDSIIMCGNIKVKFFGVTHTIPDSMGIIIETPYGSIVTPGDFKLDHDNEIPTEEEEKAYSIFKKEKVLCLLAESTNIENPGFSTPEKLVHEGLDQIIRSYTGRLIIGTFASQLERIIKIVEITEKLGKKILVEGRSMKDNVEIVKFIGRLKVKKETLITAEEAELLPPHKVVIIATGAQGDQFGALMRMANKSHRILKLKKTDTIILSASIIPGNERSVEKLKDLLARQGARIVHFRTSEVYVHSTGHANLGEIEWLHKQIKPKFFIPIHGNHYRLRLHADLATSLGVPEQNIIIPDTGSVIEITNNGEKIGVRKERAPHSPYVVDGFTIGTIPDAVIKDRQALAIDGIFMIVVNVDSQTGLLKKSPDIISRGFVYIKDNQELFRQARILIKKTTEDYTTKMRPMDIDVVKTNVGEALSKFLFQRTAKRPIVIPVILNV
jgi:ribonuclease J